MGCGRFRKRAKFAKNATDVSGLPNGRSGASEVRSMDYATAPSPFLKIVRIHDRNELDFSVQPDEKWLGDSGDVRSVSHVEKK